MSDAIPKRTVETAVKALADVYPELPSHARSVFRALGIELDLGVMTPDARAHAAATDAKIADRLADLRARAETSDTDPAPPPSSQRRSTR